MSDFWHQGGYGFYVWWSYGISAVAIVSLIGWALTSWRNAQARFKAVSANDEESP